MKNFYPILLLSYILFQNCSKAEDEPIENYDVNFYLQYSNYTDPGEYVSMYANLPDSIPAICEIIQSQLIHPITDFPKYKGQIPEDRSCEDLKYPTVQSILEGLRSYNPNGLILDRKPVERLVLSCRYHAILLASILKYKGIPTRVRYGFATYLYPNYHVYHVICEVWDSNEKKWALIDPDKDPIDVSLQQFEFANEAWKKMQMGTIEPGMYGVPDWWGEHVILDVLCHDLASVLGNEHTYINRPPISEDSTMNVKNMPAAKIDLMNTISTKMVDVDANFSELQKIYNENKELNFP